MNHAGYSAFAGSNVSDDVDNAAEELPPPVPPGVPRVGKGQVLLQAISSAALPTASTCTVCELH